MKQSFSGKLEAKARANEAAYRDRACPACGGRLLFCFQPESAGAFPSLNLEGLPAESAYYCPACRTYWEAGKPYAPYIPRPRPAFAGDGKQYYFSKAFVNGRILRTLCVQALAACCSLPPFLYLFWAAIRDFTPLNWAGAVLCGVLFVVSAYFIAYYYRMWRLGRRSYFELGEPGLIFFDGLQAHYIPWQDFQLAAALLQPGEQPDVYTFAAVNQTIVFNPNLEDYQDAALRTARRLRDRDILMNPRLLHQLYP